MKNFKRYLKFLFPILFLIVVLFGCESINIKADDVQQFDLKSKLIPLKTTKAENGFDDLNKLQEILKDKKIVAMGEATHGTKEFFEMKHRFFEFLVEKMGYRIFAIEAESGGAQDVNDYILNGTGNAKDAVKSMKFWTWSTEEVVDMVEWMRMYNKNPQHKRKIKFYGFDMQSADKNSTRVLDYVKKVDNNNFPKFKEKLSYVNNQMYSLSSERLNGLEKDTEELKSIFEKNKQNYVEKTSISEYEKVYQDLNIIIQCVKFSKIAKNKDVREPVTVRDYYMAQNVKWILNYEKQFGNDKIMLWAHNGHVTKKCPIYKSMGENLKDMFKDNLYSIGFDFYKGSFRAIPCNNTGKTFGYTTAKFKVDKSASNSFAYSFEKTGIPLSFMDFKSASEDKDIARWLSQKQLTHSIGAVYNGNIEQFVMPEVPIESYDGLIFVKETSAAVGIEGYQTGIINGDTITVVYRNMYKIVAGSVLIIILVIGMYIYKNKKA
ncbi:erythromycin esterase [Clostridium carboxidivorans P7]|uniref:Erythromycin esterase n=1 Tax=Clostridium carboxidivorans P7 TaxID=536227 RepID=C6Q1U4_9CLOT|nr:erythromycin esterase family protein [Clostridium carboxidivorans]AKN29774.1 erythromycin esterase [Clostridium carboxidivorans P7]EET84537.1 Erythromycin esterase [Clostridium carboxidivorans P7]EFG89101.1 erythromycin esterase [Clostridium carboxidivorans P7]